MSETIKLPIDFTYSGRIDFERTVFAIGKNTWSVSVQWITCKLDHVTFFREGENDVQKVGIEAFLVHYRHTYIQWKHTYVGDILKFGNIARCLLDNSEPKTFRVGDVLHIDITITYEPMSRTENHFDLLPKLPKLSFDFLQMFENENKFADITLRCGTTEIPVHKCILSARSNVFDAMFKNKMKETDQGVVVIEDMEPDVLRDMLRYMYSGKIDHLTDESVTDMLFAADKYQLEELKSVCVENLKKVTNVDNVFRVLVLGHLMDGSLKTHAKSFLCNLKNVNDLENTEGWKTMLVEQPALAAEVLMDVLKQIRNS